MTEDEAKTKWCPMARSETWGKGSGISSANRMENGEWFGYCIGSACMMWRWTPLMADAAFLAAVKKAERDPHEKRTHAQAAAYVKDNRAEFGLPTKPFEGHCGLAWRPE